MASSGNVYDVFKNLDHDELKQLVSKLDDNYLLLVPRDVLRYAQRALPQSFLLNKKLNLLENLQPSEKQGTVVVISYEDPPLINKICDKLQCVPRFKKSIFILPRITHLCMAAIERHPIGKTINVAELKLDIFSLDPHTFLVPVSDTFANCNIENDITDLYTISRALAKLQLITGLQRIIKAAGPNATKTLNLIKEMRTQIGENNFTFDAVFDELIILDRSSDLITPLITQSTYGGLLDDQYQILYDILNLPGKIMLEDGDQKIKQIIVNEISPVYSEIGHLGIVEAFEKVKELNERTKSIGKDLLDAKGTSKWRQLFDQASQLKEDLPYITMHGEVLGQVMHFNSKFKDIMGFEGDCIMGREPDIDLIDRLCHTEKWFDALRLLCIYSLTNGGVKMSVLERIQKKFVGKFGKDFVNEFNRLEIGGLISVSKSIFDRTPTITYKQISKDFKLTTGDPEIRKFYSDYVPILIRLLQSGVDDAWNANTPIGRLMNAMKIPIEVQALQPELAPKQKRRVLVFVIGGVSLTERMMIQKLGKIAYNDDIEFHVGSSSIINSKRFLYEICPTLNQ